MKFLNYVKYRETSLTDVLFAHEPGDTVQVTIERDGEQTLPVSLGTSPTA